MEFTAFQKMFIDSQSHEHQFIHSRMNGQMVLFKADLIYMYKYLFISSHPIATSDLTIR